MIIFAILNAYLVESTNGYKSVLVWGFDLIFASLHSSLRQSSWTMSSFAFRQRAGHVDWKAITSVKTENIVSKADTKQLQFVLDGATFCEFRPEDVRNNSIESVAKLVNILQFISEYLLHCQEVQFKVIRELQAKADKNHTTIDKLKKENLALKEDRKIYQRQLAMLRKSLGPDYFLNNHNSGEGRQQPVVTNLLKTTDPVPGTKWTVTSYCLHQWALFIFMWI